MRAAQFLFVLALLVGSGCSHRSTTDFEPCQYLEDRSSTQEDVLTLTGSDPQQEFFKEVSVERFLDRYFSVFAKHEEPMDRKRWAWLAFNDGAWLLEDLRPASAGWFAAMDEEAAWERAGEINKPGILLVTTALRAMPTDRALVGDPSQPGQGFLFDYLQNSLINTNEPLWLSHRSRSGKWVFVFTSYASGWVLSRDAATLPEGQALVWPTLVPIVCIEEGYPIRDKQGQFLFDSRIGMVLPVVEADDMKFKVLVATSRDPEGEAGFEVITLPVGVATPLPLAPTSENFSTVASRLLGLPYGWGGLHGNRDCSAAIRDLFMPFGLWLPRNSKEQARIGDTVDLSTLNDAQKAALIVERAVPFATLLYKKGHILLYVGHQDGVPLVFHSVWDLLARDDNRLVRRHIGRIVLSPLGPAGHEDPCGGGSTLLSGLVSMSFLVVPD